MKQSITVVILTFNEEIHLERCLQSLSPVVTDIVIVDSFSTDKTQDIAEKYNARFFQNPFINYAVQYQWGLDNVPIHTDWVMRMDADEFITDALAKEIDEKIPKMDADVSGIIIKRQVHFLDRWIKYGGYYPIKLLRIWRNGVGRIEQRWMDEHIKLDRGVTIEFDYDLIDYNLNNLSWWTQKHNQYATREAIDLLNKRHNFFPEDDLTGNQQQQDVKKRWYKDNLYARAPLFLRAFLYFMFRYFIQLGFLDGKPGLIWHFLQGFWYRFLVDSKIYQIEYIAKKENRSIPSVIEEDFKFKL